MRKTIRLILAPIFVLAMLTSTCASSPGVIVSNQLLPVRAVNRDGRVLVPLRAIFEALDATVSYDHATKTITGHKDSKIIILKINDKTASVDGKKISLDVPAAIINDSTFVPVRFIGESLGAQVDWANKTVIIEPGAIIDNARPTDDGDLVKNSGPFSIKILEAQLSDFKPSKAYKELYDYKDKLTMVTITIEVKNNGPTTSTIDPHEGILSANAKEHVQGDLALSGNVGGDFKSQATKRGKVVFLLDSKVQDLKEIKYMIHAGYDENYNQVGEDMVFDIGAWYDISKYIHNR